MTSPLSVEKSRPHPRSLLCYVMLCCVDVIMHGQKVTLNHWGRRLSCSLQEDSTKRPSAQILHCHPRRFPNNSLPHYFMGVQCDGAVGKDSCSPAAAAAAGRGLGFEVWGPRPVLVWRRERGANEWGEPADCVSTSRKTW
jgi:hypothetical protein